MNERDNESLLAWGQPTLYKQWNNVINFICENIY